MGASYLPPLASFLFIVFQILLCYDMPIADPHHPPPAPVAVPAVAGATSQMKGVICMLDDTLSDKLERIHVLADLLLDLLIGNPQAQVLTEIIIETSLL